jgi:hypothetical protein
MNAKSVFAAKFVLAISSFAVVVDSFAAPGDRGVSGLVTSEEWTRLADANLVYAPSQSVAFKVVDDVDSHVEFVVVRYWAIAAPDGKGHAAAVGVQLTRFVQVNQWLGGKPANVKMGVNIIQDSGSTADNSITNVLIDQKGMSFDFVPYSGGATHFSVRRTNSSPKEFSVDVG